MFKRNLTTVESPYAKGRWYHVFIESDGTTLTLTTSDIKNSMVTGGLFYMPVDFVPVSVIPFDVDLTQGKTLDISTIKLSTSNKRYISLTPANFTYIDLYIFGYQK